MVNTDASPNSPKRTRVFVIREEEAWKGTALIRPADPARRDTTVLLSAVSVAGIVGALVRGSVTVVAV
jgi:hypothetical protein